MLALRYCDQIQFIPKPVGVSDFSVVHSMDIDENETEVPSQSIIAEEHMTGNNGRSRYTWSYLIRVFLLSCLA